MSMNCCVFAVPSEQANDLRQDSESLLDLMGGPNVILGGAWYDFHCVVASTDLNHPPPHGFLVAGGEEIDGTDGGYGPARLFAPQEVKGISSVLAGIGEAQFMSGFDKQFADPAVRGAYLQLFQELQRLVKTASEQGDSLLVALN